MGRRPQDERARRCARRGLDRDSPFAFADMARLYRLPDGRIFFPYVAEVDRACARWREARRWDDDHEVMEAQRSVAPQPCERRPLHASF